MSMKTQNLNQNNILSTDSISNNRAINLCQKISVEYAFRLFGKTWNQIQFNTDLFNNRRFQSFDLTPENLQMLSDELNIASDVKELKIKQIEPSDYPCLVILDENSCFILTQRVNAKTVEISDGDISNQISITALQKIAEGHIILLRPDTIDRSEKTENNNKINHKYSVISAVIDNILTHHKKLLAQMIVAAIISNLMLVALPLFIMSIYDRIIPHLAFETLWVLSAGVLLALLIDLCMKLLRHNLTDAIGLATSVKLQSKLFKHLSHLKFKDVPENAGGLANSTSEFDNISQLVPQIIIGLCVDLPFFGIILLLLYQLGNAVIIAPIVGSIVILVIHFASYILSRNKAAKATKLAQNKANHIIETIALYENIKAKAIEDKRLSLWERLIDGAAFAGHEERKFSYFSTNASVIISQVVIVFTLIIGVYQLQDGLITIGGLAACSLLVGRAIAPMSALFGTIVKAYHYRNTSAVIEQIFNAPLELAGDLNRISSSKINGDIEFSDLNFAYNPDDGLVLDGLSFTIKHGEKIGIVGKVGCGKSTLMRMMVRYYEADKGRVKIDGYDIRQYSPANLRKHLIYMSQNYNLFNDTLYQNICGGVDIVDEELFTKISQITGIHEFASQHSQGYGMFVGANGERLSGGQKQSVALANCLLRQPKAYILDEPTSALDNHLEKIVIDHLPELIGDNTLIVATHRAPILKLVDRIIWMDKGCIVLDGPKTEVLAAIKSGKIPNK